MKTYQALIKLEKIEIDRIKKEMTSMNQAIDENNKILGQLNEALEQEKSL